MLIALCILFVQKSDAGCIEIGLFKENNHFQVGGVKKNIIKSEFNIFYQTDI